MGGFPLSDSPAASDLLARNAVRREGTLKWKMELTLMIGLGRNEAGRVGV